MYFVLGSIVIFYATFFGYIAKEIHAGEEKSKPAKAEEPEILLRRSVS